MAKHQSRPQRWSDAISRAQELIDGLESALSDLVDIQSEYQDWRDNLPENLDGSAIAEKLDSVIDLELTDKMDAVTELRDVLTEAEGVDLPRGFGKD